MRAPAKTKKKKKKKLRSIASINRKLFSLWSEAVRSKNDFSCELCGVKRNDTRDNGKKEKIDAHHIVSRKISDSATKFDIRNGVSVCTLCHKFGENSFHKNPVFTMEWFKENRNEDYNYLLKHWETKINLKDRAVLAEIEKKLVEKQPLDIEMLIRKPK